MIKKLPKIFVNKINKNIDNNEKIYASNRNRNEKNTTDVDTSTKKLKIEKEKTTQKTIKQKVKEIINDKTYVYKIPVIIETNNETLKTKIIGTNATSVITIDNQIIKFAEIKDIKVQQKNE
jgi:hypothetical protein